MRNKLYAWFIGIGILLFAIHNPNQPLINYIFLPQVGSVMVVLGTIYCLWDNRKKITLGSKFIWIPLAIISLSITISSIWNRQPTILETLTPIVFGWVLFGLYLVARLLGDKLFKPFTYIVVLESISVVLYGLTHNWVKNGGIASPTNYDMATGLLIFGVVVGAYKHRWWLLAVALVGLFFTGADEAIFCVAILLLAVLIRRDWSKKIWLPIGAIILTISLCTVFGITQKLYYPTIQKIALASEAVENTPIGNVVDVVTPDVITNKLEEIAEDNKEVNVETASKSEILDVATGYRWVSNWNLSPIKPFGYGYNINEFYWGIPHNIVLIIIEQVGILAMLAWLFATGYCLIKTKWKYGFIMILAMGFFDHYIWTMVGCWYFVIVGMATTSMIKSDKIFKTVEVSDV